MRGGSEDPPLHRRDAAEILGGEWRESRGRKFLVVDRKYSPGYRHGRVSVADCLPPWARFELLGGTNGNMLFLDLETTGIAGGAGTYAFLVGCGWFDGGTFRLRQFFLSDFAAERALLEAVGELAGNLACIVTYNGKTFDLPLLETRFSLQRMATPFAEIAHVDMLHPARRMWRQEEVECRLTYLEQALCGHERESDVPGFEIPSRYFQYVRSGDARPLQAVFEHNRLDIVSLAMLTARATQLLEEGPSAAVTGREAFGLGRLYERAGLVDDALASYRRASDGGVGTLRVEALRATAIMLRRLRRYEDAAATWRDLLAAGCSPAYAREASEALAVHHEHRARDLEKARDFAVQSLSLHGTPAREQATRHRLARLDRKLGYTPSPRSAALF
jgi:tetratricopeptide (TPR) repeat protein